MVGEIEPLRGIRHPFGEALKRELLQGEGALWRVLNVQLDTAHVRWPVC